MFSLFLSLAVFYFWLVFIIVPYTLFWLLDYHLLHTSSLLLMWFFIEFTTETVNVIYYKICQWPMETPKMHFKLQNSHAIRHRVNCKFLLCKIMSFITHCNINCSSSNNITFSHSSKWQPQPNSLLPCQSMLMNWKYLV